MPDMHEPEEPALSLEQPDGVGPGKGARCEVRKEEPPDFGSLREPTELGDVGVALLMMGELALGEITELADSLQVDRLMDEHVGPLGEGDHVRGDRGVPHG